MARPRRLVYHGRMDEFLKPGRAMSARDWAIDAAVAVGVFAVACVQLMLTVSSIIVPDLALRQYLGLVSIVPDPAAFAALGVMTLPLVLRRRFPWPTMACVLATYCVLQSAFSGYALSAVGVLAAVFTIALERSAVEAFVGAALAVLASLLFPGASSTPSLAFFLQVQNLGLIAAAALAGYALQTHRAYVHATEQRAAEAERTREEEAARRVEEERVRIAREVHDITAHSLSAVSIQTAAAERLIDRDPAAAKEAIASARATAKSALDDIRSMIGVLRHGDVPAETAPAAGTDRLADVAAYLESAGVACRVDARRYRRASVPAHVDLALYALAREAATNIVRHAGATHASFTLQLVEGAACLAVEDDGRGCGVPFGSDELPASADGVGHGVAGMAERARLLGGAFRAGDRPEGGFRVWARIPFAAPGPAAGAPVADEAAAAAGAAPSASASAPAASAPTAAPSEGGHSHV